MKNITKLQIDTIETTLKNALRTKEEELMETKFNKDKQPYTSKINVIAQEAITLHKKIANLQKLVSKNPKLNIDMSDFKELLTIKESLIEKPCYYNKYEIDTKKEKKAIDDYILGLKLGTALMEDMQKLLDIIAKLK